jgi:hypothetical protein
MLVSIVIKHSISNILFFILNLNIFYNFKCDKLRMDPTISNKWYFLNYMKLWKLTNIRIDYFYRIGCNHCSNGK